MERKKDHLGSRYTSREYHRRGSRYAGPPEQAEGGLGRSRTYLAGISLGALAALYLCGAVYYSRHYYPGTSVLGEDCSRKTASQVREKIRDKVGSYRLSVITRGGEQELIYGSQIDLMYREDRSLEQALREQDSLLWPVRLWSGDQRAIPVKTGYTRGLEEDVLRELPCLDAEAMEPPKDAFIAIRDDLLTVIPEQPGTTLDPEKVRQVITRALDEGQSQVSLEKEGCYVSPHIYADDAELNREVKAKNQVLGARVTLDFGGRSEVVDAGVIQDFLEQETDGSYRIAEEPVWDYVSRLAERYDTFGGEHIFQTSIGTTERLLGGDYGWLMDQNETAQLLLEAIREKRVETIEPVYTYKAKNRWPNDIGSTYVEICIARQEMWCYKDGVLLADTPVVTGNPSRNNETPAGGVWAIDAKMTDYTLVGEGYRQPVSYWMPFNGNVGIHDLQSRAYFGGTIYLTNGSHGCVNTPLEAAETIYENVEIGTPVIVYGGE